MSSFRLFSVDILRSVQPDPTAPAWRTWVDQLFRIFNGARFQIYLWTFNAGDLVLSPWMQRQKHFCCKTLNPEMDRVIWSNTLQRYFLIEPIAKIFLSERLKGFFISIDWHDNVSGRTWANAWSWNRFCVSWPTYQMEDVSQTYQVEEVPSLVGGRNMGKGMGRALARKKLRNSRLLSSREGFTNSFWSKTAAGQRFAKKTLEWDKMAEVAVLVKVVKSYLIYTGYIWEISHVTN